MKNPLIVLILIISSVVGLMSFATIDGSDLFYYAFKKRIPLAIVPNKIIVRYKQATNHERVDAFLSEKYLGAKTQWKDSRTLVCTIKDGSLQRNVLKSILSEKDVISAHPVYAIETGLEVGVTDEIILQFLPSLALEEQIALVKNYGLIEVKKTKLYHLFRVAKGQDVISIANRIQDSKLVNFSYPNFISDLQKYQIPNDEYFNQQFNLHNTGQLLVDGHAGTNDADIDAPEAWSVTQGNNSITIAVLDDGVTPNHPDLPNSRQIRLQGSNFGDGNPDDPSPTANGNHGNACAGLVAATQNNNEGISGVAPNCMIMPIRIFNTNGSGIAANRLADAIVFAVDNNADVISNSWGYNSNDPNFMPVIVAAIQYAVNNGRGGRGCVVLFAAGNGARRTQGDNGIVSFPSNVRIDGVITVGASDRNDQQADYSPSSNSNNPDENQIIDVVAPSHRAYSPLTYQLVNLVGGIAGETVEVWSIDAPGFVGDNPWSNNRTQPPFIGDQLPSTGANFLSYTGRFGGTSAACPQVAGIAALMLSLDPDLTQQQVYDIITGTADKVGGYTYNNCRSNELGFGRVNANQAIHRVLDRSARIVGNTRLCDHETYTLQGLTTPSTVRWESGDPSVATIDRFNGRAQIVFQNVVQPVTLYAIVTPLSSSNGCGSTVYSITVNVGGCPTPLGPICGKFNYFAGENDFYISPVPGAIGYRWMLLNHPPAVVTGTHFSAPIGLYEWPDTFTLSVTAIFPSGAESDTQYVSFDVDDNGVGNYLCGGAARVAHATVYPNPASDYFSVSANNASVIIYNKFGEVILKQSDVTSDSRIDIRKLPSGVYYVQISDMGIIKSSQLSVQH